MKVRSTIRSLSSCCAGRPSTTTIPSAKVYAAALPVSLRAGQTAAASIEHWSLTEKGREELLRPSSRRAPQQRALLSWLAERSSATAAQICESFKPAHLKTLEARGWVVPRLSQLTDSHLADGAGSVEVHPGGLALTGAQSEAVETILATLPRFSVHLLYGVTGSGKTEVYLQVIAAALAQGGQALVLVPEIALTPQLVDRFRGRFSGGVAVVHSGLTDSERRDAWRAAHSGRARIVIGTRSAVFTSMRKLALIVVDEEHDASYKQHEGFRYSARDLSVMRARGAGVPVILGSATPSLETLENAASGRYAKHILPQRPGAAQPPRMSLVDLRRHAADQGLSTPAMQAIDQHLKAGGQVIVFLNRRGYAPSLFCNSCGWIAPCAHCDARMTLHPPSAQAALSSLRRAGTGADDLRELAVRPCWPWAKVRNGFEETLTRLFPDAPLARLDRDTASARGAIQTVLEPRAQRRRAHLGRHANAHQGTPLPRGHPWW